MAPGKKGYEAQLSIATSSGSTEKAEEALGSSEKALTRIKRASMCDSFSDSMRATVEPLEATVKLALTYSIGW